MLFKKFHGTLEKTCFAITIRFIHIVWIVRYHYLFQPLMKITKYDIFEGNNSLLYIIAIRSIAGNQLNLKCIICNQTRMVNSYLYIERLYWIILVSYAFMIFEMNPRAHHRVIRYWRGRDIKPVRYYALIPYVDSFISNSISSGFIQIYISSRVDWGR